MSRAGALAIALLRAGRGRALPVVFLGLALLTMSMIDAMPLSGLRDAQFDHYQRHMPRQRDNEPVIIVGIDSESLTRHGQWPWSRDLIAQLAERILAGNPLALGIDIVFTERDRHSPEILTEKLPELPKSALSHLPEPDQLLARSLAAGPTVLAIVGLSNALPGSKQPAKPLPVLDLSPHVEALLPHYASALASRSILESAANGEGLINASPDKLRANNHNGVLRRVPTIGLIDRQPFLSLPLEMVRIALGAAGTVVPESSPDGLEAIRIGDYRLPTQPNGELLLHYGPASSNYYLSASDVLAGVHPPETFKERFVIIGFNSTGLQDRIITPLGDSLPGIDVHVQIIESLLTGEALKRPAWMPELEQLTLLLAGLLLIAVIPVMRPAYAVASFVGLAAGIVGCGYLAFRTGQWLFDGATPVLLLSPVFTILLSNTLITADARRRDAERQLSSSREEAARVTGELDAARRIQMGLLPDPARLFADETRFSVAALLEPARAVGGDFYDCHMLDDKHLCLAIGDVSGKGVPASLFMAISKTLSGTMTRRESDLGKAVRGIEAELSRENPEYLFVTAFIAVIDVDDGRMEFVCAGHDAPLLLRDGTLSQLDTEAVSGPPLCALGDFPYTAGQFRLQAGDLLCLFTDGVTEAGNGSAMFGRGGLENTVQQAGCAEPKKLAVAVRDAVRLFEAGHPPADDLTLLVFHWRGGTPNAN